MATNFPASLDTLTNPTSSDSLSSPSHSAQHANANDAIEALQAKVGADSSAVTSSHDYKIADHASRITTLEGAPSGGLVFVTSSTFSSVTSANIDNCFTSDYANYLVTYTQTALASSTHDLRVRFRSGGTTDSSSQYRNRILTVNSSSAVGGTYLDSNFLYFGVADSTYRTFSTATVYGPNLASNTGFTALGSGWNGGGCLVSGSLCTTTTQYDGIHFYHAVGGTFSGTVKIYGIADS